MRARYVLLKTFGKTPLLLGVSSRLRENIEDVAIRVDGAPNPVFLTSNWDNDFIKIPFVVGTKAIAPNAICEMRAKLFVPQPDRFPADNHAPFNQKVFDVGGAHSEVVVSPNSVHEGARSLSGATYWVDCS